MPTDNNAHIDIQLAGTSYPATFLNGTESISAPYEFNIEFLVPYAFKVKHFPGSQVIIKFTAADNHQRRLSGLVQQIEETGTRIENIKKKLIKITVIPRLTLLQQHSDQRILLGRTAIDIVKETLQRHGYKSEQLQFHLQDQPPIHPYTLQVEQSDFDFIQRVLARDGIFYYFDCETREEATFEVIHFLNATSYCPYLDRKMIRYSPSTGMSQASDGKAYTSLYKIQEQQSLVSNQWSFHDYNDQTPETTLFKSRQSDTQGKLQSVAHQYVYGQGTLSLDNVDKQAKYATERALVRSHHISASGDVADIAAGRLASIDAAKFEGRLTADYLITQVVHHLDHRHAHNLTETRAGHDQQHKKTSNTPDYHCDIMCIKREIHYRPELPPRPEIPLTFSARIESDGPYASLDNQGRYSLRKLLDMGDRPHTQAVTPPLRKLQPLGGPMQVFQPGEDGEIPQSIPTGMHFPLQDGDEVLLSCLNGDPDRPMIVGSQFDANRSNVVTNNNHSQNRWRSQADNELMMDDKMDKQVIQLRTCDSYNILQFDAKTAEHHLRLATEHGSMHLFAKQTLHEKSDDTHEERSGNNRMQVVENKSVTTTNKGEIHHQTPTDTIHTAGYNLLYTAEKNIEMEATQNQVILVEDEDMNITVDGGGGFRIHIKNDELHIQVAKEIRIEGQAGGDITFHQSGGGFCVTKTGNIKLFGQDIQIAGDQGVTLNGNVNYTITAPPPGPSPAPQPHLAPSAYPDLVDLAAPVIEHLAWSKTLAQVEEPVLATFHAKNFKGGEEITINIFEADAKGKNDLVDTLTLELDDGTGHQEISWFRPAEQAEQDLQQDQVDMDTGPLEYFFTVTAPGAEDAGDSDDLWLIRDVEIQCQDDEGKPTMDGTEIKLTSADNVEKYGYVENGIAFFNDVVVGPIKLEYPEGE